MTNLKKAPTQCPTCGHWSGKVSPMLVKYEEAQSLLAFDELRAPCVREEEACLEDIQWAEYYSNLI